MKFEEWKAKNAANLEHYRATCQYDLEQTRTVNLAGQSALKANVFLNAGSAVAILAFLANVFDNFEPNIAYKLIVSVGIFATGALLGSIATGFTYLSQYAYDMDRNKLGHGFNVASNSLIFVSYNLFVIGGYIALVGIGEHFWLSAVTIIIIGVILAFILILINTVLITLMIAALKEPK